MRTEQELSAMAVHISYELQEFYGSLFARTDLKHSDPDWNRILESVLLHFRNLRGFFVDTAVRDDVSAKEYVQSWNPISDRVFGDMRDNLNKTLTHLTWDRLTIPLIDWPIDRMKIAIDTLVEDFKKAFTPAQAKWFSPANNTVARGMSSECNSTVSGPYPKLSGFHNG